MKYMGSKARIAKHILPIILKDRQQNQYYVEPFVGGCNMIDKVDGPRIGGDLNGFLIEMRKGLQMDKSRPLEIPKELYSCHRDLYNKGAEPNFLTGWVGWMGSFNGRFFDGGYSGKSSGRDYVAEQIRNTEKQIPLIKGVEFYHSDYSNLPIPDNSIIYCDIPYQNTKQYSTSKNFDYDKFWDWCRNIAKHHKIFVSEYSAPKDFQCVWEMEVTNSMHTTKTYKPTERLFTI